jgi:diguanylate cyclase (GGDEF)-like protein
VLCEIARRLARTVRTEDVLGRFGGEEFLVVARDIDLAKGAQLAERLRRTVGEDPIVYEARTLAVSASFGVATLACCGEEPQLRKLLAIADTRLYAAKHGGRNRVVAS